jgi:iron(III) transport system permease protein
VIGIATRSSSILAILPMGLLLAVTAAPLIFLLAHFSLQGLATEWSSFAQTLAFAVGGAGTSTFVGGTLGIILGTREFFARKWLFCVSVLPIAAPPAFWWIGVSRLPWAWGNTTGTASGALVAGLVFSPIALLLVVAALRQMPSNLYESARVALPPVTRFRAVLVPLLKSPLASGFALTLVLLFGESEIPFLFGFRTLMTDIVTTFSQTFDVGKTLPLVLPLLLTILTLGLIAAKPLVRTILSSSRGTHGVVQRPGSVLLSLVASAPAAFLLLSISGYALPLVRSRPVRWPVSSLNISTATVSIVEPVACAWLAMFLTLAMVYSARRSFAMRYLVLMSLLLFCVPAAIYAIGWIGTGQVLGGLAIPPIVAYTSRAVAVCTLGFAVGYSRLPVSLENAARLVRISTMGRALTFVLPLIAPFLIASSALVAALTYADRDVASLLLPPGASRLTLNLYLASANAPSLTVSVFAFAVLVGAGLSIAFAAAGPALLWMRRRCV